MSGDDNPLGHLEPINHLVDPTARAQAFRPKTVIGKLPEQPDAGLRHVLHPGRVRHAIGRYDCTLMLADAFEDRHGLWVYPTEVSEDLSYQREAATYTVIQCGDISVDSDRRVSHVTNLATVEAALLRIFFEDVGLEAPFPHMARNGRAEQVDAVLWDRSRPIDQIYDLAAGVYRLHTRLIDEYGPECDRIGWYLTCWLLLAGDAGSMPSGNDTFWFTLRQAARSDEVPNDKFVAQFKQGLGLLEGHGLRRYWFTHQ